ARSKAASPMPSSTPWLNKTANLACLLHPCFVSNPLFTKDAEKLPVSASFFCTTLRSFHNASSRLPSNHIQCFHLQLWRLQLSPKQASSASAYGLSKRRLVQAGAHSLQGE